MVTSAEEYAAANLQIDGPQWGKPSAFKFIGGSYTGDYRYLISSRGGFDYLTAYHLKDTYSNSTCIQSRRRGFESHRSLHQAWDRSSVDRATYQMYLDLFLSAQQGVVTCYFNATRQDHSEIY